MGRRAVATPDPNQAQHWTNPLLCEETWAKVRELSKAHIAPSELQTKDPRGSRGGRDILAKVRTLFRERRWLLHLLKERPHMLDSLGRLT
jgi:hypothetical protein